ncbi:hypothetical protein LTR64_007807 [Lithohypha guttulata]|uniref:uncharacterized protein n=1 Tax=Lithohypha guttulata TaxID=1690604 RepID=UPI002DE12C97|nr:hypothetical protein LTR51_007319 [Lithohypha guttulata]
MAVKAIIPFLVGAMLLTGCCNTLLTKYQDMQCVRNCDGPGKRANFEQPVIQTVQMFIGEMGCWLVVFGFYVTNLIRSRFSEAPVLYQPVQQEDEDDDSIHRVSQENVNPAMKSMLPNADDRAPLEGWRVILLGLPACCDITGTTLMNVGLLFVAASIYQMTRGALVLFVGAFSVLFLKRKLYLYHWLSLLVVVTGVALVGLAGAISSKSSSPHDDGRKDSNATSTVLLMARELATRAADEAVLRTIIGVCVIAAAQIFTATQFVLEEFILEKYALQPLKVVAWEGTFGLLVTLILQVILHFAVGNTRAGQYGYFDAKEGYKEVFNNKVIATTSLLIMISIGGFNFFGLSVTRSISATSRSIIDTCRTLFIWIVSLGLGWESFKWLQVAGFALLVYGTFTFNDLVRPPIKALIPKRRDQPDLSSSGLLPEIPEGELGRH